MSDDRTLAADRLRELVDYDPETGVFRWKAPTSRNRHRGAIAGTLTTSGYRSVRVDGNLYRSHRLAWLYVHGVWPTDQIDHINGVKDDNRIVNLREATNGQNQQNLRGAYRSNTSGFVGVHYFKESGRWRAGIRVDGKRRHLGEFDTPEEAASAYRAAKRDLHPFWNKVTA